MALTITTGSATMTTVEYFLASASTVATYQTTDAAVGLFLDCNAMAAGDEYDVKGYEKVNGGTARLAWTSRLRGAQATLFVAPTNLLGEGWEFSVTKLAGTDRAIAWSIRSAT